MDNKTPLLVIAGPTATGKTRLAVDIAKLINGEVVSADSMQVYKHMDIGTAKPTALELNEVPHHLIDFLEPGENFSVARYVALAKEKISDIYFRKRLPVLCGGTGLYINSLVDNISFDSAAENPKTREKYRNMAIEKGNGHLHSLLEQCDPTLASRLHPNNLGRVIRALEFFEITGKPFSEHQIASRQTQALYEACMLGLFYKNRELLYDKINKRVDSMIAAGLVDEAAYLFDSGYGKTAIQAIGYKELQGYFDKTRTLDECVERIKMETRRYAKRQITWFKRDIRIHPLYVDDYKSYDELLFGATQIVMRSLEAYL